MPRKAWMAAFAAVWCLANSLACGEDPETNPGASGGTSTAGTGGTSTGGGASTGGSGGGPGAMAELYCEGLYIRDQECGVEPTDPAVCLADSRTRCLFELTRPEIALDLVTCVVARPCSEHDDRCLYQVGADHPTGGQSEYMAACNAKHAAGSGVFSDDWCYTTILTSAMYADLTPCFDLPCDQVSACYDGASWPASCS